jgi:hypothetical protein
MRPRIALRMTRDAQSAQCPIDASSAAPYGFSQGGVAPCAAVKGRPSAMPAGAVVFGVGELLLKDPLPAPVVHLRPFRWAFLDVASRTPAKLLGRHCRHVDALRIGCAAVNSAGPRYPTRPATGYTARRAHPKLRRGSSSSARLCRRSSRFRPSRNPLQLDSGRGVQVETGWRGGARMAPGSSCAAVK